MRSAARHAHATERRMPDGTLLLPGTKVIWTEIDDKREIQDGQIGYVEEATMKTPVDRVPVRYDIRGVDETFDMRMEHLRRVSATEEEIKALADSEKLHNMRLKNLRRLAKTEGVPESLVVEALNAKNPKAEVILLLLDKRHSSTSNPSNLD